MDRAHIRQKRYRERVGDVQLPAESGCERSRRAVIVADTAALIEQRRGEEKKDGKNGDGYDNDSDHDGDKGKSNNHEVRAIAAITRHAHPARNATPPSGVTAPNAVVPLIARM